MVKTSLIILLLASQTAYSQKTRRSDSKTETQRNQRSLRADIFGECLEDEYVLNADGTIDTFSVPNLKKPDCFGMEIKKPVYRKPIKKNIPSKGQYHVKPPKRRPVIEMLTITVGNRHLPVPTPLKGMWEYTIAHQGTPEPICNDQADGVAKYRYRGA
jgi:hypothetical protein